MCDKPVSGIIMRAIQEILRQLGAVLIQGEESAEEDQDELSREGLNSREKEMSGVLNEKINDRRDVGA